MTRFCQFSSVKFEVRKQVRKHSFKQWNKCVVSTRCWSVNLDVQAGVSLLHHNIGWRHFETQRDWIKCAGCFDGGFSNCDVALGTAGCYFLMSCFANIDFCSSCARVWLCTWVPQTVIKQQQHLHSSINMMKAPFLLYDFVLFWPQFWDTFLVSPFDTVFSLVTHGEQKHLVVKGIITVFESETSSGLMHLHRVQNEQPLQGLCSRAAGLCRDTGQCTWAPADAQARIRELVSAFVTLIWALLSNQSSQNLIKIFL